MSPYHLTAVSAVFLLSLALPLSAQTVGQPVSGTSHNGIWSEVSESDISARLSAVRGAGRRRDIIPQKYRTVRVNKAALTNRLRSAALETAGPIEATGLEFEMPHPAGGFRRFLIQESPILDPELAARYPEIKTYIAQSVDDPGTTARIDLTPRGFHAMILSAEGQIYIDPYSRDTDTDYISYFKQDLSSAKPFECQLEQAGADVAPFAEPSANIRSSGGTLKTYRLALACTGEYAAAVCSPNTPSVAGALAAMVTSVNRTSAIYEREFAIRFVLVQNTDKLIFLDGSTDPYSNGSGSTMLGQNQSTIDSVIGTANYDIGHVFSTGGGGIAMLAAICTGGIKARGVTGSSNPVGDPYDVDYVAHEIGHQLGANHPFDGTSGSCEGNGNSSTAYEPGSGTTIMAYAGICTGQNLSAHSDDYFHTISYDEIITCTAPTGSNNCAQTSSTGNTPPTVGALTAFIIPAQTPFALTASATDPDGDTLTYCWEEFDRGPFQDPTVQPRDNGSSPLFRSYAPRQSPVRYFPALTYILNNQNVPPALVGSFATGEFLPATSRTMNFRITVRDNHPGGGGTSYNATTVTSVASAGPFAVTAPNTGLTIPGGSQYSVTWKVGNTNVAPINCANVKISLSTDGGNTFPIVLAEAVPNNGAAAVTIVDTATTQGRIKIEAVGNIFFDISDANLTITSTNAAPTLNITNGISVVRGQISPTVAAVGTASDAEGTPMTVSVSDLPFGAHVTPTISNGTISLSATVDCSLVTNLLSRTYPITLTVADSNGSQTSAKVNLMVAPNPAPVLGVYGNITVTRGNSGLCVPTAPVTDSNGNLAGNPYTVAPTTLPGGGTVTVNQSTGAVTATTTSSTYLGAVPIKVTAVDSCGAAAVRIFNFTIVAPTIPLLQSGQVNGLIAEGCAPANGAVDPGETVTINLPIINSGETATTNLVATLQASGGVTPITTSQNYGAIAGNSTVSRAFQLSASGKCGDFITVTLQLQDGATGYGVITYSVRLGNVSSNMVWSQNFDGVVAPLLPAGWTATVASGVAIPWLVTLVTPNSPPNSAVATAVATVSDNRLTSPVLNIPGNNAQLTFKHRWNLEDEYDGGILEISINGGVFTEIIAAGGTFVTGGYTGTIASGFGNPIAGLPAWTGDVNTGYTTTTINLPASALGKPAQLRWRLGSDNGIATDASIWRIDTIALTTDSYLCAGCSLSPQITSGPPPGTVVVGTPFAFSFSATGNPAPSFSIKSGTLPQGLSLSPSGVLSGVVNSAAGYTYPNIVVAASNGNPPEDQQVFSLTMVTRAANYFTGYGLGSFDAAWNNDNDRDGISNLAEYGLTLNPTIADVSALPVVSIRNYGGTNFLSMTFHRSAAATDLTYRVQVSSDLVTWTDLATSSAGGQTSGAGFVSETGSMPNLTVEVRDTVALTNVPGGRRFLRLRISSP
ncbi:MAG TPA: zinc-dependent metalloprotease family protein [Chthoniobacterales bacterium]|nr:zinc-dependent metalloprotease family protein [Chthoniobacterales bacterium]